MLSKFFSLAVTVVVAFAMAACGGGSSSSSPPAPTVTLTSSATDVGVSVPSVTLTWSSTQASSCAASDAWSGTLGLSGSQSVIVAQTSTYTISCSGRGGVATASVTVHAWVPPSVVLTADRATVPLNGTAVLTWSTQNATECRLFPSLPGTIPPLPTSGSQTTAPLTEITRFWLLCGNPIYRGGTAEVVVEVLEFTVLELPMERATALNDAGDVAGSRRPADYGSPVDAVVWTEGSIVFARACQDPRTCFFSYTPRAINAARTVIGGRHHLAGSNHWWSFVWHFGDSSDPNQDYFSSVDFLSVSDINDAGQIVGARDPVGHAVLITGETVIQLSDLISSARAINAAGHIAGEFYTTTDPKYHIFLYVDGAMKDLGTLGGGECHPTAINAADAIVGSEYSLQGQRAFRYADSRFTDLGSLGGTSSWANGINDAGRIVGTSTLAGSDPQAQRAFLYVDGKMFDLNDLAAPLPALLTEARKINNRGQIIANACPPPGTDGNCRAYLLTPVSPP